MQGPCQNYCMKSLLPALLLFATACTACTARYPAAPPTMGFYATVDAGRPVRCVWDGPQGIDARKCAAVGRALGKINAAVGYQLLVGPFWASADELVAAKPAGAVTYVVQRPLPAGVLGLTAYATKVAVVVLSPDIWADANETDSVVLHELLHSVGAGHAEQLGNYPSVERPVWQPGAPTELTRGDIAALRAAYAQL